MAFDIGAGAAVFVDGRDLSRYLTSANVTRNMEAVENTRFDPANLMHRFREFLAGLQGGAVSTSGCQPVTSADTLPAPNNGFPNDRGAHDIYIAPFGGAPGNLVLLGHSLQSRHAIDPDTVPAVVGYAADYQLTQGSPGVAAGVSLFNPHGTDTVEITEEGSLAFTNAPAVQEFRLLAAGGTDFALFTPGDSNAAIKAAIESISDYAGFTVTVTGSRATSTVNGVSVRNGTLTIAFSPAQDAPALVVKQSESHRFQVVAGDGDSDYSYVGGAPFALGINEAALTTNLQAIGGNYAAAVAKGASTAYSAGTQIVVTDADSPFNGTYVATGATVNGAPVYAQGAGASQRFLSWFGGGPSSEWRFSNAAGGGAGGVYYSDDGDIATIPETGWLAASGASGTPTVDVQAGVATPGTADFSIFFPYSVGGVTLGAVTGTGATRSRLTAGSSVATAIVPTTATQGLTTRGVNLVDSTETGAWVRTDPLEGATGHGALLVLQAVELGAGSLTVLVEHAPDSAGSPGTAATLGTFAAQTATGAQVMEIADGVTVDPWIRARVSAATGKWQPAVGFARRMSAVG